ncbi:hypothetical protein [Streptomyces harbinensis]|uniref:hypothetical protein n=1 Tax=Streptomyces harbinensis TaxID=1176198 RepID=UPI0036C41D8C
MRDFAPETIPVGEYPHPVGTVMRTSTGTHMTVVDRDGRAFLACCATHEQQGVASGYHPSRSHGRLLDRSTPAGIDTYICPGPGLIAT